MPQRLKAEVLADDGQFCSFGIGIAAGIAAGLEGIGVGGGLATAVGTGLTGAAVGAGLGAATSAIEGKKPGQGALFGGITGGAVGAVGPAIGGALGGGTGATVAGDVLAGAAGGALGSAATGQSPLTGIIEGAASGGVAGFAGGVSGPTGSTGAATVSSTAGSTGGAAGAASPGAIPTAAVGGAALDPTTQPFIGSLDVGAPAATGGSFTPGAAPAATAADAAPVTGPQDFSGGGAGGVSGAINNLFGHLVDNPAILLGGGILGAEALMGNKPVPAQQQVQKAAGEQASVGRTLESYSLSGTLPSGLQEIVNQNTNAGVAAVKSRYAELGLSGSTMEAQAIQQIHEAAAGQTAQIANQLLSQGAQFTSMSNQELSQLLQTQLAQETGLQTAIANFAGALAGARRPNTVAG
jgi:hypothetical protein